MTKDKRVIFRISDELDKDLQILTKLEKKTTSQYLRSLIEKESTIEALTKREKQAGIKIKELNDRVKESIKKKETEIKDLKKIARC